MKDPNLIWPFTGISAVGGFFAFVFLFCYWNLDKTMAKEDAERETARQSKITEIDKAEIQSLVRVISK